MKRYVKVLSIAGSDSGGGAGIQADLKTFAALGCYGMSVITALTAQNTCNISNIYPIPPKFIDKQFEAIIKDIGIDAVKIGILFSTDIITHVTKLLKTYKINQVVVDPVMVSTSGKKLLNKGAIQALKSLLLPLAKVITPNLQEAAVLLNQHKDSFLDYNIKELKGICKKLSDYTGNAILIKGGHSHYYKSLDLSVDLLFIKKTGKFYHFDSKYIKSQNTHGTGCTLSSAIASNLAKGYSIENAVLNAKNFITAALKAGREYQIGKGKGPVHHFYQFWA